MPTTFAWTYEGDTVQDEEGCPEEQNGFAASVMATMHSKPSLEHAATERGTDAYLPDGGDDRSVRCTAAPNDSSRSWALMDN